MSLTCERLVFVDVETAGVEPSQAIIQLAAVAVNSQLREKETFEVKIHVERRTAAGARYTNRHFNRSVWRHCSVEPRQAAEAFSRFLRRHATIDVIADSDRIYQVAQLVAHNSNFDGPLLQQWFEQLDIFLPASYRVLCTMQRAIWLIHEDKSLTPPTDFKLNTLCQYFGVPLSSEVAHEALTDARATVGLYRAMMNWSQTKSRHRACG